jgi:hypothetical protein
VSFPRKRESDAEGGTPVNRYGWVKIDLHCKVSCGIFFYWLMVAACPGRSKVVIRIGQARVAQKTIAWSILYIS